MPKTKKTTLKQKAKQLVERNRAHMATYLSRRPHRSFKLTRRPHLQLGGAPLPSITTLLADTSKLIWRDKKLFLGIAVVYGVLSYFLVGGVSQIDFVAMREVTVETMGGDLNALGTLVSLFGGTITGVAAEAPTQIQQFMGSVISFIFWLAFIWAVRMRLAGERITVRDALYNCCAPLIPSILVMLYILVQLSPALLALFVYAIAQASGWLAGAAEMVIAVVVVGLCCLLSAYWVASSAMAMVVVTLPHMYPWRALSAASELVIGQRWYIALHIGVMLLAVTLAWAIVMLLALFIDSWLRFNWLPLVPVAVQALTAATLLFTSTYIYKIYRSLI